MTKQQTKKQKGECNYRYCKNKSKLQIGKFFYCLFHYDLLKKLKTKERNKNKEKLK